MKTRGNKNPTPGARTSSAAPKKAVKAPKQAPKSLPHPPPAPPVPFLPPVLEDLPPSVASFKSDEPSDEEDSPTLLLCATKKAPPKPTTAAAVKPPILEDWGAVKPPHVNLPDPPLPHELRFPDSSFHTPKAQVKHPSGTFDPPPARPVRSQPVQNPNQPTTVDEKRALIAGAVSSPNKATLLQDSYLAFLETEEGKEQHNLQRVSNAHAAECTRLFLSFIHFITNVATFIVPFLREIVPSIYPQDPNVPRVIHFLGGVVNREKIRVANALLTRWSVGLKNSKDPNKHLQPNTHARKIRSLLGYLRTAYDWQFSLEQHFNFPGGLAAVMKNLFEQRLQFARDRGNNDYGTLPNRQIVSNVRSVADLCWSVFNESNPSQFQEKIMAICACYFGFRGRKEHAYLCINQIRHGVFEAGHDFAGKMFFGVAMQFDKGNALTLNRTTCRGDTTHQLRIPVMDINDQNDPGGSIHRYIERLSPGQLRMYCHELNRQEKAKICVTYPKSFYR